MHSTQFLALIGAAQLAQAQFWTVTSLEQTAMPSPTIVPSAVNSATADDLSWTIVPVATSTAGVASNSTDAQSNSTECTAANTGYGPVADDDTVRAFYDLPEVKDAAMKADTPSGYTLVYQNDRAATHSAKYLSAGEYESYDVEKCAKLCDTTKDCQSINIYFERTPSVLLGPECKTAPSMTVIKCVLWGDKLLTSEVTNSGNKVWDFQVAVAGSNGYSKTDGARDSTEKRAATSGFTVLGAAGQIVPGLATLGTLVFAAIAGVWF